MFSLLPLYRTFTGHMCTQNKDGTSPLPLHLTVALGLGSDQLDVNESVKGPLFVSLLSFSLP